MSPPCRHLVIDEEGFGVRTMSKRCAIGVAVTIRSCLLCGVSYDRLPVLRRLREQILERHRLPPSPWSASERAEDSE